MILSLLIWYFIPLQLCSPHCTTCVYCLKHTCQIKEQLMHLIFNYCLLHHHAQWENVKASNLQYFKQQSVRRDHRALMHTHRQEFEYWIWMGTSSSLSMLSWLFTRPFVTKGNLACDCIAQEELRANINAKKKKKVTIKHPKMYCNNTWIILLYDISLQGSCSYTFSLNLVSVYIFFSNKH